MVALPESSVGRVGVAGTLPQPGGWAVPPPPCGVPVFGPIRAGGGRHRFRRAVRTRRRALAAGLAVTAAALAASAPRGDARVVRTPSRAAASPVAARDMVRAPVRIADAAAVGLLRTGDRVDVLAGARVVARSVPVVGVPEARADEPTDGPPRDGGALIVLAVPRPTAAALSGAAANSALGVVLC